MYFDLDGTLCSYDTSFEALFRRTVSLYGEPTDVAHETYVDRLLTALDRCESDPYRRAFEPVTKTITLDVTPTTLAAEYCERELEATVVTADAKRVLDTVAATNPTGIITNGDGEHQRAKLDRHELADRVDEVLVSNDCGVRKPDRQLFELAKECLDADEFIYVGDSYDEDIVGAREAGFRTVYVDGGSVAVEDAAAADGIVSSIGELLDDDPLPAALEGPFAS
ncbi:HAD family hydrolase [Natrialba taiwanensis]|uniref:HAD-superfamily hydrolase n=1 Tax=Natrialba taiwanensis DSM 12281 TaxID=1230458 RepID=L9ZK63_9EURY|nr:HAD-superfamily hydrolase [Natrialba taiwanensis DSM 12281]